MRAERRIRFLGTLLALLFLSWPASPQETSHYSRIRDAKWYARQLQSLREEVAKIDTDVRSLVEARKYGKGITDAVALDQEPEGVTSEGQMEVLRKRRVLLLRQIDELEEQARHNAIVPGELRTKYGPEEPATPTKGRLNREAKDLENSLAQEKEHLEHARKEVELLQRNQKLKAQQEYSNPEPPSRRNKPSELVGMGTRLVEKEAEVQETEQRVAELEDRLTDLRRNSPLRANPRPTLSLKVNQPIRKTTTTKRIRRIGENSLLQSTTKSRPRKRNWIFCSGNSTWGWCSMTPIQQQQ